MFCFITFRLGNLYTWLANNHQKMKLYKKIKKNWNFSNFFSILLLNTEYKITTAPLRPTSSCHGEVQDVEDYLARSTQGNDQNLKLDNTVTTDVSVWVEPIPNPNCLGIPTPISVKMAQTEISPNTSTEILAEINTETKNFHSLVQ
jgi:hypothetical protein